MTDRLDKTFNISPEPEEGKTEVIKREKPATFFSVRINETFAR